MTFTMSFIVPCTNIIHKIDTAHVVQLSTASIAQPASYLLLAPLMSTIANTL